MCCAGALFPIVLQKPSWQRCTSLQLQCPVCKSPSVTWAGGERDLGIQVGFSSPHLEWHTSYLLTFCCQSWFYALPPQMQGLRNVEEQMWSVVSITVCCIRYQNKSKKERMGSVMGEPIECKREWSRKNLGGTVSFQDMRNDIKRAWSQ